MSNGGPSTLRLPLILLAIISLGILGMRLWPWQDVMNLPGNGTAGIDPAISLLGYIGLFVWIGGVSQVPARRSLSAAAAWGFLGGAILVAHVLLSTRPDSGDSSQPDMLLMALLAAPAVLWGIAGLRASRSGHSLGFSVLCAIWAAMVSGLMACTAVLAEAYFAVGPPESPDPWKQYEGLAIGTPATQALVHALNTATGFLLIGPIVGCVAGLLFASLIHSRKA
jgi:hypothetical protein